MKSVSEEFEHKTRVLNKTHFDEATARLRGVLEWMEVQPAIKAIIDSLDSKVDGEALLNQGNQHRPPPAATTEEIASVGLALMRCASKGTPLYRVAYARGIKTPGSSKFADTTDAAMSRYIEQFLNYVRSELPEPTLPLAAPSPSPAAIRESLQVFHRDYPETGKTCFIMMQFRETTAHDSIERAIKDTLTRNSLIGVLARDKEYCEDLYPNIQTYLHGCAFGIAVFERIETDNFNPNVSLEVGYMFGLRKPVLLLKEQTLKFLQTDLLGKLYKLFDAQHPDKTIPPQIERWLEDRGLI